MNMYYVFNAKHKYACNQTRASTWCANIYMLCMSSIYACKHINIINLWIYLLYMSNTYACNQPHQHYVWSNIYYVKHICLQPNASTLCMNIYHACHTYACNQTHQYYYVWIYIMSRTYAYKHINIIYVWRYIMHAKHIRLQSNASIWCVHILCMPSTYVCKRMYGWIYIMHVKHICLQTHRHDVWINILYYAKDICLQMHQHYVWIYACKTGCALAHVSTQDEWQSFN